MALLRRLEKRILVRLPNLEARSDMLSKMIPSTMGENLPYDEMASKLEGYSGSDIRLVCKETAMKPLRRLMTEIEDQTTDIQPNWAVIADPKTIPQPGPVLVTDFDAALATTKSAAKIVDFRKYEKWMDEFGSV